MMSRAERPSKNSNAANHHMVPLTSAAQLPDCFRQSLPTIYPLFYDTMMMVVGESSEKKGAAKAQAAYCRAIVTVAGSNTCWRNPEIAFSSRAEPRARTWRALGIFCHSRIVRGLASPRHKSRGSKIGRPKRRARKVIRRLAMASEAYNSAKARAPCRRGEMCETYPADQSSHACRGEQSYEVHYRARRRSLVRKSFAR